MFYAISDWDHKLVVLKVSYTKCLASLTSLKLNATSLFNAILSSNFNTDDIAKELFKWTVT
jgi:hypothetical protein